jgi:S1-C subfamily serine protease
VLRSLASLMFTASVCVAATIPKGPAPDPLGKGYIGFYPIDSNSLIIDRVEPGSPAEKAGLRPGDSFMQIGTFKPKVFDHLKNYVSNFRPGTEIQLTVKRGSELKSFTLKLGARPVDVDFGRSFPLPIDPEP